MLPALKGGASIKCSPSYATTPFHILGNGSDLHGLTKELSMPAQATNQVSIAKVLDETLRRWEFSGFSLKATLWAS